MDELRELYQEVILDHGKHPRNFKSIEDATSKAHGNNPLCGDQLTIYIKLGFIQHRLLPLRVECKKFFCYQLNEPMG